MKPVLYFFLFLFPIGQAFSAELSKVQMAKNIIEIQSTMIGGYMQQLLPDSRALKPSHCDALINMAKQIATGKLIEYFSEEELQYVLSFYESETGKQIQAKIPLFLSEFSLALGSGEYPQEYDIELLSEMKRMLQENFPEVYVEKNWDTQYVFVSEEFAENLVNKYFSADELLYMGRFEANPLCESVCSKLPSFIVDLMFTYIYELTEQAYQGNTIQEDVIEVDLD